TAASTTRLRAKSQVRTVSPGRSSSIGRSPSGVETIVPAMKQAPEPPPTGAGGAGAGAGAGVWPGDGDAADAWACAWASSRTSGDSGTPAAFAAWIALS